MRILKFLWGVLRFFIEFIVASALYSTIAKIIGGGDNELISLFGLFMGLITAIALTYARIKKRSKTVNPEPQSWKPTPPPQIHSDEIKPSPTNSQKVDSGFVELPGALDHIRFRYVTKDKRKGTYTVAVMNMDDDRFSGYCFERRSERSFLTSSILDNEVIRATTGEVLTVSIWLEEHGYSLSDLDDYSDEIIDDNSDYISFRETTVDVGAVKKVGESFLINPNLHFPIYVTGCSKKPALELQSLLNRSSRYEDVQSEITYLIAQHNIEFPDVFDFLNEHFPNFLSDIDQFKASNQEYQQAEKMDQIFYLSEFIQSYIESKHMDFIDSADIETLLNEKPKDLTVDDEILSLFSNNRDLYSFFIWNIKHAGKLLNTSIKQNDFNKWKSLEKIGLAKRGKDIPASLYISSLTMKKINEFYGDRLDKPFRKKADAILFASKQPDAYQLIGQYISLNESVVITLPEDTDIQAIRNSYSYSSALANVINATYTRCYRAAQTVKHATTQGHTSFQLDSDTCCPACSKHKPRRWKIKSYDKSDEIPPFHIGCNCRIDY